MAYYDKKLQIYEYNNNITNIDYNKINGYSINK